MSSPSHALFESVTRAAGNALMHREVLRRLIDEALPADEAVLMQVAFTAKFLVRTWGVLKKLGPADTAAEQLKSVFHNELEKVRTLLEDLCARFPANERNAFEHDFLAIDGAAFVRLMELLHDCSWIKNVEIDSKS